MANDGEIVETKMARIVKAWRWPRPSLLLAFGLVLGFSLGRSADLAGAASFGFSQDAAAYRLIPEAWWKIQRHYVDQKALNSKRLAYAAIDGMVNSLGDTGHSTFLGAAMVRQLQQAQHGRLQGIGVEIEMKAGKVTVVAPIDNSPAARAGIRAGDVILMVDGRNITDLPVHEVVARVTGKPGTKVDLTILDPDTGHTRETSVVRETLRLHSVTWRQLPGTAIAFLRIAGFDEQTAADFRKALVEIQKEGLSGLILDLRNNPGGILDAAVSVASQFLDSGNVLLVKNAQGRVKPVPALAGGIAFDIPLVVLVNGGSASGSEIIAGAVKASDRAPLVGETTFGTGTVLQQFQLSDGSALLLAVQEWLTPSGESFWHKGIEPNVTVKLPPEADILSPADASRMTATQLLASGDIQLIRALQLLRDRSNPRSR